MKYSEVNAETSKMAGLYGPFVIAKGSITLTLGSTTIPGNIISVSEISHDEDVVSYKMESKAMIPDIEYKHRSNENNKWSGNLSLKMSSEEITDLMYSMRYPVNTYVDYNATVYKGVGR